MGKSGKNWGHKIFYVLIVVAFAIIIVRFSDIRDLYYNIKGGNGYFILAALFFQLIYFYFFASAYSAAFHAVGINTSIRRLYPLIFAYIFVNVVAPTWGISGPALLATEASRRKQSSMKTLAAVLLANIAQFVTFMLVLIFGFFYMFVNQKLHTYQVLAGLLLLGLIGLLVLVVFMGLLKQKLLISIMKWFYRRFNSISKFFKSGDKFLESNAAADVVEFSTSARRVFGHPKILRKTFMFALLAHLVNLISLSLIFFAFHQNFTVGILVSGYVMAVLFQIIGITPYGIGLSEGAMTLVLASFGVPTEKALLITLVFRGISFWIPFFTGFILLRKIHLFGLNELSIRELLLKNKYITTFKKAVVDLLER